MGRIILCCVISIFWAWAAESASMFGTPLPVLNANGKGMAVALDGNRLYAGVGSKLYSLDVSDPLHPALLGELDGFDNLRQMRAKGDFVYVVSRETGMRIVDVSNPVHMRIRSRYDSVEFATGIEVVGNVAFLSERIYGIEAVDVQDPDNPTHIAMRKTSESQSCRYHDGWLFSGEWESGEVTVFDAHDMSSFRAVAKMELGGFGDGVEVEGNYLYCSTGHDSMHRGLHGEAAKGAGRGLDVFDVSDPVRPKHVSRVDFPVFAPRNEDFWTPRVANGLAFCCDSHNGLFAVNVRDPAHPEVVDRLCIPDPQRPDWPSAAISSLEIGEGCLYMTCTPGGLFVVPVAAAHSRKRTIGDLPRNASYREKYETDERAFCVYRPLASGQARSVAMRGDVAYVAFGDAGLHVVRISSGGGFEKLGELPGGHRVTDCCFVGERLLVAEGLDGFALYELDDPIGFKEVSRRPNAGMGGSVAFWCWAPDCETVALSSRYGPYVFYGSKDFETTAPLAFLYGTCQWDRYAADVAVSGGYPILVPYKGLAWVKIGQGCVEVIMKPTAGAGRVGEQRNGVSRFGDRFLYTVGDGYEIVSAAGKSSGWHQLGKGGFKGVPRTDGRRVLITERSACRVSVWDFKDENSPKLLSEYRLSGNPDAGTFFEGRAVIPAGHQGLLVEKNDASAPLTQRR